jgi:hypothetical protein
MFIENLQKILSNLSIYANHPEEFLEGMIRSLFKKPHPGVDFQALVKTSLQTPTSTGIAMWWQTSSALIAVGPWPN